MSSAVAMKKHHGSVKDYRASEGKYVLVPYRGAVNETLKTILGGIRSACTYVGAKSLKELSKRTTFIRVNYHHNVVFGDEKEATKSDKNDNNNNSNNTGQMQSANESNSEQKSDK